MPMKAMSLILDAAEDLGIGSMDRDEGRARFCAVLIEPTAPLGEFFEDALLRLVVAQTRERFVVPCDGHIVRSCIVCRACDAAREGGTRERRVDDERLIFLQADSHAHDQACIFFEKLLACFFVHALFPF